MGTKISEGHARALMALKEDEEQAAALRTVVQNGLSVRQAEELVQGLLSPAPTRPAPPPQPPEIQAVEARQREALGTRVRVTPGKKGGRLVIYYYSEEELQSIYDRLLGA